MIILRDLPDDQELKALAKRYPDLDAEAAAAFLAFLRTACDIFQASEEHFARNGMSCGRFTVLALLNRHGDGTLTPSQIADACGVTRATITGLLDNLEQERLIRRERSASDRRTMHVRLTDEGRRFLDRMLPDHFRRMRRLMAGLGRRDRSELRRLSGLIAQGLPALSDPDTKQRTR
ncbi:MAG: MarR family transcriptional regulator [Planctomycetes bacterium]|nr:MarR family transcriptional regulator [Planctomycetota bacterium]